MARLIKVDPVQTRAQVASVRALVDGPLAADIARYRALSNKLARSKGDVPPQLKAAVAAQAASFENTRQVYSALCVFLTGAAASVEAKDASLARGAFESRLT